MNQPYIVLYAYNGTLSAALIEAPNPEAAVSKVDWRNGDVIGVTKAFSGGWEVVAFENRAIEIRIMPRSETPVRIPVRVL